MSFWTDERVDLLKKLWRKGHSAGDIAERWGTTRNTVLGKLHRLGMLGTRRGPKIRKQRDGFRPINFEKPKRSPARPAKPTFAQLMKTFPLPEDDPEEIARTTVLDREPHQCAWVIGQPAEGLMCGAPVVPKLSSPFCSRHARRAFSPPEPKRVAPAGVEQAAPAERQKDLV